MRNSKSLVKNSIFNIIYKGFTALFPLLTTSYIARVLLPEGVGRVEYAMTIVSYFVTAASLGIPNYGIKAIAQGNKTERNNVFLELFIINSISTIICLIGYYLFIFNVQYFGDRIKLFYVVGSMLFLNLLNVDWFFQGVEEYSYIAVRGIIIKVLSFIAMILFVKTKDDYLNYAFILCMATAGNYVLNLFQLRKYITLKNCNIHIKRHLIPVLILFVTTVATQIYTMLDSTMLEYIHGELYVGYYSNAVKIVRMVYTVSIAMVVPFYPRISNYIRDNKTKEVNVLLSKGVRIISLIAIPAVFGLFFMSDWIVLILFGEAFTPTIVTLKILSPLVIVFSFAYFLGHIILMSLNKEKMILLSTVLGASVNVILNILLIPRFKHNGAAFSSLVAEIMVTGFVIIVSKNNYKLEISNRFIITLILALFPMCVILILKNVLSVTFANMCILCFVASLAFFSTLFVSKNDEVVELCQKLKSFLYNINR